MKEQLGALGADPGGVQDLPFVVHGTGAEPRFLDTSLEPTDREPGTLWGPAAHANLMPASLGHHTSLRSWLSQWSVDESNCDGPYHLTRISVQVLDVYGTADQVCFPSHARAMFDAVPHDNKKLVAITGGTHYLQGQPALIAQVAETLVDWLASTGVLA